MTKRQNWNQSELRKLRMYYGITETLWHYGILWHYVTKIRNIRKSKNNYGKQVYFEPYRKFFPENGKLGMLISPFGTRS